MTCPQCSWLHTDGSVDWIEVETGLVVEGADPILIRHSNKDTVEQKIMENNEIRFRLMESTPPMNEPLLSNLGFFLTSMPQNVSSMELTSVLRELMLTPRTSSHHSKSPLQSIRLTSSPTVFHCRTIRRTGNGARNAPPPPYLVCTLVIGRLQLKAISSPNSMLSSLTSSSPLVTLPSGGSKGYWSCLKRRRGYAYLPNSMPSY